MFEFLTQTNRRPQPFEFYTTEILWNDEHISQHMLKYHLMEDVDMSSRNHAFIDRSVEWIAEHFSIDSHTRVCDFGCGPGLYTTRLARYGARVTGVDFSRRSLDYARKTAAGEGLAIDYFQQNYLEFECDEPFQLVTMIMCDFCALSPQQRRAMLHKFAGMLSDDGSVLLDVYSLAAFEKRSESAVYEFNQLDGFWSAGDYYAFVNTFKYEAEKVMLDQYTIVEPGRTWQVYNWLQYFSLDVLRQEFAACGLDIREVYADVAGSPYREEADEYAVVVTKRH